MVLLRNRLNHNNIADATKCYHRAKFVMVCIGYARPFLEGLHEEILGVVEFHEVS